MFGEDIVLHGRVGTASETPASQELMKRFHSVIKKNFTKVKAFFVGPAAWTHDTRREESGAVPDNESRWRPGLGTLQHVENETGEKGSRLQPARLELDDATVYAIAPNAILAVAKTLLQ